MLVDGCGLLDCLRGERERDKHEAGRPDSSRVSDEPGGGSAAGKSGLQARRLGWAEVESVTCGFSSRVIGQGGFSTVYLASLSSSRLGAVKVQRSSERLHRVFRQELDVLMAVRHPHIVRLLGYCDERGNQLPNTHASNHTGQLCITVQERGCRESVADLVPLLLQRKACWCSSTRPTATCTSGSTVTPPP
jgi:hypothetical protein